MDKEQIQILLQKFREQRLNAEERKVLSALLDNSENRYALEDALDESFSDVPQNNPENLEIREFIYQTLHLSQGEKAGHSEEKTKVFSILKKISVAASILLFIGLITFYFIGYRKYFHSVPLTAEDIAAPDKTKATITLADGKIMYPDSLSSGQIAQQGSMKIIKSADGQLSYKTTDNVSGQIQYNTLNNPVGSKVTELVLSDSTHVWLNAGSSITFPVAFTGNERIVSMTGEAYFEVAHNKSKPFYVNEGKMQVRVLGTHFNVSAYEDESNIKVTLLEGSVQVASDNQKVKIVPGQQAILTGGKKEITVADDVDIDQVTAWKNGRFDFNQTDLQSIMREIHRWYGVDVVYENSIMQHFNGSLSRQINISKVLEMLGKTGGASFQIEGNKVIVKRYGK